MPPGQPVDLAQRRLDGLDIVFFPALEEGDLVAEVANMRAPTRHDDGVGHQVLMPPDQIPPDGRHTQQGSMARDIAPGRVAGSEVLEEAWPGIFARTSEYGVGVQLGLVG